MNWLRVFAESSVVSDFFEQLVPSMPLKGDLRINNLEVRLAQNTGEIEAAQRLRFRVFYEEMSAKADSDMTAAGRDFDKFDEICDHMLVVDHNKTGADSIVGTYRMLRRSVADKHNLGFYTAQEYDIKNLLAHPGELLEVGRSCVDAAYRTRPTLQLLWRGIASYIFQHDVQLIFGCASLPNTDPDAVAEELSYLHAHHLAPPGLRAIALPERCIAMERLPVAKINPRAAMNKLPPLIKGYIRLGGFIGDGAVIDEQWGSIDICIIVKTDMITDKYMKNFERTASAQV